MGGWETLARLCKVAEFGSVAVTISQGLEWLWPITEARCRIVAYFILLNLSSTHSSANQNMIYDSLVI